MTDSYRMHAAYLYFARPTPIVADQWARQVLQDVYPTADLARMRIAARLTAALPTTAQVESDLTQEGYAPPEYRWSTRELTDSSGNPFTLVEVLRLVVPADEGHDVPGIHTPTPFTRRDLTAGALAGIGGGLAMGLLAMGVAFFVPGGESSIWVPLNQIASTILGPGALGPNFNLSAALIGLLVHIVVAAALGAGFALIYHGLLKLPRRTGAPIVAGAVYGLLIGIVASVLLPLIAPVMAFAARPGFIVGQLVFGIITGLIYAHLRLNLAGVLVTIAALLFLGAGVVITSFNLFMPIPASAEAAAVDTLFNIMLGLSTVIFLIVEVGLLYAALRYARKKGDNSDGPPLHGNNTLEIVWTAVPAIIVLFLAIASYQVFIAQRTPSGDDLTIEVTGQQFQWSFYYPDADVRISNPDEALVVPTGRKVQYRLMSKDVIHAFWVPNFRIKRDVMPGQMTDTFATATLPGEYPIVCAELCGAGHATMRNTIRVVSPDEFNTWIEDKQAHVVDTSDPIAFGRSLFQQFACTGCHTLADAGGAGMVGPNLNHIGTVAATRVPGQSAEQYILDSIVKPGDFLAPDCPSGACPPGVMPGTFGQQMSEQELQALVTYLASQK